MHKLVTHAGKIITTGLNAAAVTRCDKWSQHYRIMGNPFPGNYSFKYHPWAKEMHTCRAEEAVGQKAAQMGFTEVMLNIAFFTIDQLRRDVLYVLPAKTPDATDFSRARFDPALELSDHLRGIFTNVNNVNLKRAGANCLYVRGSRSRSALKSLPAGAIFLDEVDEFDPKAISLVRERMSGQRFDARQLWQISTPSIPGHGVNSIFERSTKAHFFFKCPHCSRRTELIFPECLVICGEVETDPEIKRSHLICKECKHKLEHESKPDFLSSGRWVHAFPDRDIMGYHISQLYSYTITPIDLAKAKKRADTSRADEQEFYNSKLGLPHIVAGAAVTDAHIEKCKRSYKMLDPAKIKNFCTIGIDVGTRCHYEVVSWRFKHDQVSIDINDEAIGTLIYAGTFSDFNEIDKLMLIFKPTMTVIDNLPETRLALAAARRWPGRIKLCHYGNNVSAKDIIDHGEKVTVDRTSWLDIALSRFMNQTIELPMDLPIEYAEHIKSLIRVFEKRNTSKNSEKSGFIETEVVSRYHSIGNDHWGHARNYSEIALKLCAAFGGHQDMTSRVL